VYILSYNKNGKVKISMDTLFFQNWIKTCKDIGAKCFQEKNQNPKQKGKNSHFELSILCNRKTIKKK